MKSSLIIKISTVALVFTLSTSNLFLILPNKAHAQAGAASSCFVGYALALGQWALGVFHDVAGVPAAQPGQSLTGATAAGSTNSVSFNNCVLKPLGTMIVIALIRNIGASVVDWVNSGFNGSPTFVTDFAGTLTDAADQAVGKFIEGSELGWLCNDFSFQIRIVLALKYSKPFRERVTCTLSGIGDNVTNFADNNGGRGWNNWLQLTTQPANNVYGAYLIADSELARRALQGVDQKYKRIAIGGGFLDTETCDEYETPAEAQARYNQETSSLAPSNASTFDSGGFGASQQSASNEFGNSSLGGSGAETSALGDYTTSGGSSNTSAGFNSTFGNPTAASLKPLCKPGKMTTKTPGARIAAHLDSVLGQGEIQAAVAQEIDQVIAATLNQVAQQALMGVGGLLGSSKKNSSGSSYISRYRSTYYGVASSTTDTGATSPIDNYRVVDYNDASALLNDSNNKGLQDIQKLIETTVKTTAEQQKEQFDSAVNSVAPTDATVNSALSKAASQSSGSNPEGANDGITKTSNYSKGSQTANNDSNAWWEVDLGKSMSIKDVEVWKTSGGNAAKTLGTFRVLVSEDGTNPWVSPTTDGTVITQPIIVSVDRTGRYVRIEKDAKKFSCGSSGKSTCYYPLELGEVQVMTPVTNQTGATGTASSTGSTQATEQAAQTTPLTIQAPTATQPMSYLKNLAVTVPILAMPSTIIPLLEISLLSNGTPIRFDSVLGNPVVSIKNDSKTNPYSMDSVGVFPLANVTAGTSNKTSVTLAGQALSFTKGSSYQFKIVAKDATGAVISTGTVNFVVQ
ncbi:MAG: discoidin domain-containing protein [Candidatus Paceibacterota bacterium]|jgi:hypothetical protein